MVGCYHRPLFERYHEHARHLQRFRAYHQAGHLPYCCNDRRHLPMYPAYIKTTMTQLPIPHLATRQLFPSCTKSKNRVDMFHFLADWAAQGQVHTAAALRSTFARDLCGRSGAWNELNVLSLALAFLLVPTRNSQSLATNNVTLFSQSVGRKNQ